MDLNSFSVFLTVAEEMNFSRAADRLYMTQQALSGYVKRMEEAYHVQLFERKPFLRLTPAGEAMVSYARSFIETENAMISKFADISGTTKATLRLGLPAQRSSQFIPMIWDRYRPSHSNISITIEAYSTIMMTESVRRGTLDISMAWRLPNGGNLGHRYLFRESNFCFINRTLLQEYFPNDWRAREEYYKREGVELLELKDLPFLLPPSANAMRRDMDQYLHMNRVVLNSVLESPDQMTIFNIARKGVGVGVITPLTVYIQMQEHPEYFEDCMLFKIKNLPDQDWYIVYRDDIRQPDYVMDMMDTMEAVFREYSKKLELYGLQ